MKLSKIALCLTAVWGLSGCLPSDPEVPSGAEDFAMLCAPCHGSKGDGKGDFGDTLGKRPADLTLLAGKNDGKFPMAHVMSKIWGYAKEDGHVMPQFAPLLETDMVLFDSGDGILTPTPLRLVQLAEYVKTLQE